MALVVGLVLVATAAAEDPPRSADARVVIEPFAREPDIVTPTGVAVDARGRVLVVECHTHFPPENYAGPTHDRLRWLLDNDGDGRAETFTTYYEGMRATMGLAIGADGWTYVATRNEIFRLRDTDGDEHADARQPLARLETQGNYPHNGLAGFAFDCRGGIYFGLGENLGANYRLVGSDGTTLAGGGEGGSIYHSAADGTQLTRVATGFWNPFHLAVDPWERLFAVDNDPDSRPPCRLLHVVEGGDYGYRYRNGRKGLHPFTAWNGELPGTLPMMAGTGEAPSGVVVYESDALPDDYRGELFVTSWGDHRIDRFRPAERGASLKSMAQPWITGGENFRPVGLALAPNGTLYATDWVDKSYELHGRGAVWRIRPADFQPAPRPTEPLAALRARDQRTRQRAARALAQSEAGLQTLISTAKEEPDSRVRATACQALVAAGRVDRPLLDSLRDDPRVEALTLQLLPPETLEALAVREPGPPRETPPHPALLAVLLRRAPQRIAISDLLPYCADPDPFLRAAALSGLERRTRLRDRLAISSSDQPHERLAGLWLLQALDSSEAREALPRLLADPAAEVRFAAIEWVAGSKLVKLRPLLVQGLESPGLTRQLFEGYLAALEQLDAVPPEIEGLSTDRAFVAPVRDVTGQDYIAQLLTDDKISPELRRRAVRMLDPTNPLLAGDKLIQWLTSADPQLQLEGVRSLRETVRDDRTRLLAEIAGNGSLPELLRLEAVVGLDATTAPGRELLLRLAAGPEPNLRRDALRSLRGAELSAAETKSLATHNSADPIAAALLAHLQRPHSVPTPDAAPPGDGSASAAAVDDWLSKLAGPADAAAGERVFFHPPGPLCYRCHQIDGRGGRVGPDLTSPPQTMTRRRLVESIVAPSQEIAPQFVLWSLARSDGTTAQGVLLAEGADGAQTYVDSAGRQFVLRPDEIAERSPQPVSVMPAGLVQRMTDQEFRDLLAYLLERRD
ncbi:MAG: c-type cytochrome [Planctomycetaceae bacterium]|nr:c-type cytochrome [Planctomycetaceae bacterium]